MGDSRAPQHDAGDPLERGGSGGPEGGETPTPGGTEHDPVPGSPTPAEQPAAQESPAPAPRPRVSRPRASRAAEGRDARNGQEKESGRRGTRLSPHLTLQTVPSLRNPVLVMSFEGWNDAGEAA